MLPTHRDGYPLRSSTNSSAHDNDDDSKDADDNVTDNDNADNHADDDNPDSGNADIDADSDDAETMAQRR